MRCTPLLALLSAAPLTAYAADGALNPDAVRSDPFAIDAREEATGELRWGAYGELHYNRPVGAGESQLDLHRLVFLAEYDFDERTRFVTEIEIEHAFIQDDQGELEVEQAYIDFVAHDKASVKAGVLLVPISIMNLYHEPVLFHGVERPTTASRVVPTTWFEPGIAVHGSIQEGLSYEVAVQAGMDNENFSSSGIRGGRQKAYKSRSDDLMVTARIDYRPNPELWLAAAVNSGGSGHSDGPTGNLTLYTLEGRYTSGGLSAGLSWGQGFIGDADEISLANGSTVPESFHGLEAFVAYDVAPHLFADSKWSVEPFIRYEIIDTQASVPDGFTEDQSQTGDIITIGITAKPHPQVAIKADFQQVENDADTDVNQFNLGIGWMF